MSEVEHKFEFPAEILPDNERTAKIMKERQEKEAAEKEKYEQALKQAQGEEKRKR